MQRIIAGVYRGLKLDEVNDHKTRPTTDKNKETLFNILGQYFDGGKALDLYSGSGALGIESFSRGISHVTFVDHFNQAINTIQKNVNKLKNSDSNDFLVIQKDVMDYLKDFQGEPFDLILVDPPYKEKVYEDILSLIEQKNMLTQEGVLVFESDRLRLIDTRNSTLIKYREKVLGNSKFHFFGRSQ